MDTARTSIGRSTGRVTLGVRPGADGNRTPRERTKIVRSPPSAPHAGRRLPSVLRHLPSTPPTPPPAKLRLGGRRGTRTRPRAAIRHFYAVIVLTWGLTAGAYGFF